MTRGISRNVVVLNVLEMVANVSVGGTVEARETQ